MNSSLHHNSSSMSIISTAASLMASANSILGVNSGLSGSLLSGHVGNHPLVGVGSGANGSLLPTGILSPGVLGGSGGSGGLLQDVPVDDLRSSSIATLRQKAQEHAARLGLNHLNNNLAALHQSAEALHHHHHHHHHHLGHF